MKKSAINNKPKEQSNVKVIVRVRPLIGIESGTSNVVDISPDEQSVKVKIDEYNVIETKFDKTLSQYKNQKQMFDNIQPFVQQVVNLYNLTIFAYGQTGSGKTFTMFGKDWQNSFQAMTKVKKNDKKQSTPLTDITVDDTFAGIIPRACYYLFHYLEPQKQRFNVFCSFLQVYNEKIYDLLNDSPTPNPLNIHESKQQGIFVQGLGQFQVKEFTDCLQLMGRGQKNRKVRQTSMNAKSSRSHTIFKFLLQQKSINGLGGYSKSSLSLCDLAGSEKINKKQKMNNIHLEELKCINLSLTTLGKVIYSLSKGPYKNTTFFRESKLTRLLQDSLLGNTNTFIIGAISPSSKNVQETINTLKFVERAKHIKLTIKQNYISNQNNEIIAKLQLQMQQLKKMLKQKDKVIVPPQISQKLDKLESQNQKLKGQAVSKEENIKKLIQQNKNMKKALTRMERLALDGVSGDGSFHSEQSENSSEDQPKRSVSPQKNKKQQSQKGAMTQKTSQFKNQSKMIKKPNGLPYVNEYKKVEDQLYDKKSLSKLYSPEISSDKRRIITRLQGLQQYQKNNQNKLIRDLDFIEQQERNKTERMKKQTLNRSLEISSMKYQSHSARSNKKQSAYRQKIKQLESRLRK